MAKNSDFVDLECRFAKRNEFGNLLVKVNIVLPENLSEQEMGMFRELAALQK